MHLTLAQLQRYLLNPDTNGTEKSGEVSLFKRLQEWCTWGGKRFCLERCPQPYGRVLHGISLLSSSQLRCVHTCNSHHDTRSVNLREPCCTSNTHWLPLNAQRTCRFFLIRRSFFMKFCRTPRNFPIEICMEHKVWMASYNSLHFSRLYIIQYVL